MGQELLDYAGYVKTPRVYYLGVASNGVKIIRGSAYDRYTHAVVVTNGRDYETSLSYGTFHARHELALREYKRNVNAKKKYEDSYYYKDKEWEVVSLTKITAKEVRQLKKQDKQEYKELLSAGKNLQETETENNE